MSCIALLTDFGTHDWFVGTMKGVIASIAPKATVIDLCHDIPPGDVKAGAFALLASYRYFPRGTIFVAVVDPGVGGPREAMLAEAHGNFFIGPDNGVLAYALSGGPPGTGGARHIAFKPVIAEGPGHKLRAIENPDYRLPSASATFHGRDVFAPAAAHLFNGKTPGSFGRKKDTFVELPFPVPYMSKGAVLGEVVHIDRFGNAITNITPRDLEALPEKARKRIAVKAKGKAFPLAGFYAEAKAGGNVAVAGSSGFLELAINGGDAAKKFGLKRGEAVKVA
jgi:S-adenosylmethionine hydrolase